MNRYGQPVKNGKRGVSGPFSQSTTLVHSLQLTAKVMEKLKLTLILLCLSTVCAFGYAADQKIYGTGLEANKGDFSVSPDGRYLIFGTNRLAHGLRLLNLGNGVIQILPPVEGRNLGYPSWSPDGKQVAVVSAVVENNRYSLDGMEIVLLDANTWQQRKIAVGDGVKFSPFFSSDGKTVYYIKGKKRTGGKTPASRYDLFAINLASGQEIQKTHEAIYQMSKGDDDGHTVLLSVYGWQRFPSKEPIFGFEQNALFEYNKVKEGVRLINIDQTSGISDLTDPQRDKAGNIYFIATKRRPEPESWYLVRSDKEGRNLMFLTELPIGQGFDVAKNTGEIYVMDKKGKELIFRKLTTIAAH